MRQPIFCYDEGLLGDEPFRSSFAACAAADTGRQASRDIEHRMRIIATEELYNETGGPEAARAWLNFAFCRSRSELKKRPKIELTEETCLVFVNFYWKLYRKDIDDAALYLFQELRNRKHDYMLSPSHRNGTGSNDVLRNSSSRGRTKKSSLASHRVSVSTKKQVLYQKSVATSEVKTPIPKRHRDGFEGPYDILVSRKLRRSMPANEVDTNAPKISRRLKAPPILKTPSTPSPTPQNQRQMQKPFTTFAQPSSVPLVETSMHYLSSEVAPLPEVPSSVSIDQSFDEDGQCAPVQSTLSSSDTQMAQIMRYEGISSTCGLPSSGPTEQDTKEDPLTTPSTGLCSEFPRNIVTRTIAKPFPALESRDIQHGPSSLEIPSLSGRAPRLPVGSTTTKEMLTELKTNAPITIGTEAIDEMKTYVMEQDTLPHDPVLVPQYKSPLSKPPPIWAQSRQEVCESFEWFRSYQGGVYYSRGVVKGYLLSAFSSCRDRYLHDGRLIISHGGGKAESIHSHRGLSITQPADDQLAQDKSVRALLSNFRQSRPLVLLVDDKYALFPYDLGATDVTYAVLGFYTIMHAWAERQPANNVRGYVVRYKFAFQWCEGQGEPWWISHQPHDMEIDNYMGASPVPSPAPASFPTKVQEYRMADIAPPKPDDVYFTCNHCHEKTPQVYQEGWTCLNATCGRFWTTRSGILLPYHSQLRYNEQFTRLSTSYQLPRNLSLRPTPPESSPDTVNTTYAYTRGWHCRKCGRLSCRDKWEDWECANCHATTGVPGRIRTPKEFWAQKIPVSFLDHYIRKSSGILQQPSRLFSHGRGMGQVQTFILPDGRGRIHHIQSVTPLGNLDADEIFREYQEQASAAKLKFRRWPMRSHKCRGPLLTNYFSQNSGEPYQYVGGTANTVPFSEAPSAVVKARYLIQNRIRQALEMESNFNEVLSAAYMERQRMAFHSDSEPGLGPLVAGLSMGSPALMHFRVHHKHQRKEGIERKVIVMTFVLRHGDVLVMDGHGVQEYYEHTVVPTNFRIAATARDIKPTPS